jgi:predicted nucleic-acid-binding protein
MPLIDRNRHRHIVYSYLSNSNVTLVPSSSLRYRHSVLLDGSSVPMLSVIDRMSPLGCSVMVIGPKKYLDPQEGVKVDCSAGFVANVVHGFQANKDVLDFALDYKWNKQNPSGVLGNIKEMIASTLDNIARADINITMAMGDFISSISNFLLPILGFSKDERQQFDKVVMGILHLVTQGKVVLPEKEFAIFDGFDIKVPDLSVKKTYITLTDDPSLSSIGMAISELEVLDLLPKFLVGRQQEESSNKVYRSYAVHGGGASGLGTQTINPDTFLPIISTDYNSAVLSEQSKSEIELPNTIKASLYEAYVFTIGIHLALFADNSKGVDRLASRYIYLQEDLLRESFGDYDYEKALDEVLSLGGQFSEEGINEQIKKIFTQYYVKERVKSYISEEAVGLYFLLFLLNNFKLPKEGVGVNITSIINAVNKIVGNKEQVQEASKNAIEKLSKTTSIGGYSRDSLPDFDESKFKRFMQDVLTYAILTIGLLVMPDPKWLIQFPISIDEKNKVLESYLKDYLPDNVLSLRNFYRMWYDQLVADTPFAKAHDGSPEKLYVKIEALSYVKNYVANIAAKAFGSYDALLEISTPTNFMDRAGELLHKVLSALNFVQLFPPGGYNFIPNFPALVAALYNNKPCVRLTSSSDDETGEGVTYFVGHYGIVFRNIDRMRIFPVNDASRNGIFYLLPTKINLRSSKHFTYSSNPERYGEFSYPTWLDMEIDFTPINTWIFLYGNFLGLENLAKLLNISNVDTTGEDSGGLVRDIRPYEAKKQTAEILSKCRIT